jgi:hypothetical protein
MNLQDTKLRWKGETRISEGDAAREGLERDGRREYTAPQM